MTKSISILAGTLTVVFVTGALLYCPVPASSLPAFLPGYDPSVAKIHFGSLLVGLALLAYARFGGRQRWQK
jgi:hypothetical protein